MSYTWDCDRCLCKGTLTSSHIYFSDWLNRSVPAGICECSKCGMRGLACPHARGVEGVKGIVGKKEEENK